MFPCFEDDNLDFPIKILFLEIPAISHKKVKKTNVALEYKYIYSLTLLINEVMKRNIPLEERSRFL